jgi:hypothetical protein
MYIKPVISGGWRLLLILAAGLVLWTTHSLCAGTFPMIEASFKLPSVQGNPFDYTQNDVQVKILQPDGGTISLSAFFDGGDTWRVRHTPQAPGKYSITGITLNGQDANAANLQPHEFDVAGPERPGFVRIDPNAKRFMFDDGSTYYPVGYNLGWRTNQQPPIFDSIARMGKAGINWTRIWMCYWDGKNLDWANTGDPAILPGQLNLNTAKLWDQIVAAADAADIHFHLVLQHHGQYSTGADPNWNLNPWNKANGGWLAKPEDFFTDPKAIAITRAKFHYIVARWGYSPAIMAWELFNEVEFTDAYTSGKIDTIAAWHAQMAKLVRETDPYHHLIVTSSKVTDPKLWGDVDYYEAHVYPPDVLSAVAVLDADQLKKPYFYGELGLLDDTNPKSGIVLHKVLWGSLMSGSAAAAQYWSWDVVEPNNLLFQYTAAQKFIAESGELREPDLHPIEATPETADRVAMEFGPGTSWAPATQTDFTIKPTGIVEGLGGMSAYLQGVGKNNAMCPSETLHVSYTTPGTFAVKIDQTTPDGARVEASIDGQLAAILNLGPYTPPPGREGRPGPPRNPRPDATLELPISAGEHTIHLQNTGDDWAHIDKFILTPYAPSLAVLAKGGKNLAILWVYNRAPAVGKVATGRIRVPGLAAGPYNVAWVDTRTGQTISEGTAMATEGDDLIVDTPPVASDIAGWIRRAN